MQLRRLTIKNFRGIESMVIHPRGHVVLIGEPRAGRSTVLDALRRVLDADASVGALGDDLEFFCQKRDRRVEIEAVVGDLGSVLAQQFFDRLEYWDADRLALVEESPDPSALADLERVVRFCYRAAWSADDEQADHWVDYPKLSDPSAGVFERVRRADLRELPFFMASQVGRPLSLATRGRFRSLVDRAPGSGFPDALDNLVTEMGRLGVALAGTDQVKAALDAVLKDLRGPLGVRDAPSDQVFAFAPEGGGLAGVLRALSATTNLSDPPGALPLTRHGSTLAASLGAAEALVAGSSSGGVVVIDDFGEQLDDATSRHLASQFRRATSQTWLSTRRAAAAFAFRPREIARLVHGAGGWPEIHQGRDPVTKPERTAARHLNLQVLPAMAARALVILEGPHDRAAYEAVAERRLGVRETPLPAAQRIALADAGAADSSGGASAIPRLVAFARGLGFFGVVVLDGDTDDQGQIALAAALNEAHAVIRLPDGIAIERALLDGLSDAEIRTGLHDLDIQLQSDPASVSGDELRELGRRTIKSAGGLHAQFVDALPPATLPALPSRVLDEIEHVVRDRRGGLTQL